MVVIYAFPEMWTGWEILQLYGVCCISKNRCKSWGVAQSLNYISRHSDFLLFLEIPKVHAMILWIVVPYLYFYGTFRKKCLILSNHRLSGVGHKVLSMFKYFNIIRYWNIGNNIFHTIGTILSIVLKTQLPILQDHFGACLKIKMSKAWKGSFFSILSDYECVRGLWIMNYNFT